MLDHLDAGAARRWVVDALAQLSARRAEIDALNVYPVPDSDTGTNLCLTVEAGAAAVHDLPEDDGLPEVADAFARGALLGARGGSGVILSQLLRGWADVFRESPDGGPAAVRAALARAADQAYAAVARPVEGTMLTVARAAADGAQGRTLRAVVQSAVESARTALARTTEQLDVLRRADVVDAGGRGLVVVLESLAGIVQGGREGPRATRTPDGATPPTTSDPGGPGAPVALDDGCAPPLTGYEVMFLLDAGDDELPAVRDRLDRLGEALVVVGGGGLWNVHVHTEDVAGAIRAGRSAGHVHRLSVTSFARQRCEHEGGTTRAVATTSCVPVVVDVPDECLAVLADHGARAVPGWSARSPEPAAVDSLAELTVELVRTVVPPGVPVLLVPATAAGQRAAERAASALPGQGGRPQVLAAGSLVQALAATSVHDRGLDAGQNAQRMAGAVATVRWGEARSDPPPDAPDAPDALDTPLPLGPATATVSGRPVASGATLADVAVTLVDRLLDGGGELLTILRCGPGGEADDQTLHAVLERAGRHPGVEVTVLPAVVSPVTAWQIAVE